MLALGRFIMEFMAGPMEKGPKKSFQDLSPLQATAVRLYAAGHTRLQVARILAPHMYPAKFAQNDQMAQQATRKKLRSWEETAWWRDIVYDKAIEKVDTELPTILKGMRLRARRRVDAARLMLEVSGRHNPRGEQAVPAAIHINLAGAVPRPENRQLDGPDTVDGEVVEDEDAI